jgi:hypothetical protein
MAHIRVHAERAIVQPHPHIGTSHLFQVIRYIDVPDVCAPEITLKYRHITQ